MPTAPLRSRQVERDGFRWMPVGSERHQAGNIPVELPTTFKFVQGTPRLRVLTTDKRGPVPQIDFAVPAPDSPVRADRLAPAPRAEPNAK